MGVSAQQSASLATLSATLAAAVGHENFSFDPPASNGKKVRSERLRSA